MTQIYGSFQSRLMEVAKHPAPEIGMGATITWFTDRVAGTIIGIGRGGKLVKVQEDKATRTDSLGMSESQDWAYEPDPTGMVTIFTLRRNGLWVAGGSEMTGGPRLAIGHRSHYYDFSF